ncbi:hypothetical protein BVH01_10535 [Pseudomonas sp. PA1(2017)]|uniref:metallophosphoesterase n=1 Tax=Pseudomonas sp. PA1(2017) TaxID=1932113 RepID=UPI00095A03C7|nr:metallophosphoesterase [Pseudomonas sp. PA1(2017)]OLU16989.1 hypothetical protein BVH01_10535 [Pseudomonas sp. PA1(2017)]
MKIHILSDLHLEFASYMPAEIDADVVVLAGDVYTKGRASVWASGRFKVPTVLVAGNHDAYGASLQGAYRKLQEGAQGHVHFLEREIFVHQDVRFIGCTAWTDFRAFGSFPLNVLNAQSSMNDYRVIRLEPGFRRLRASDTQAIADESRSWLLEQARVPFAGKTVVVTHHAPLLRLLPSWPDYGGLDAAYANEWIEFLSEKIDLWIFGHTHHAVDVVIDGTRFVSNPRGYPGEQSGFRADLVIEL